MKILHYIVYMALLIFTGCSNISVNTSLYAQYITLPEKSYNIQEKYVSRGQGKILFLKFDLAETSLSNLFQDSCLDKATADNSEITVTENLPDLIPSWWNIFEKNVSINRTCTENSAIYQMWVTEEGDSITIYIQISIL